jgi:hypothetical protein
MAPPSRRALVTDIMGGSVSGFDVDLFFFKKLILGVGWQQPIPINNDFYYSSRYEKRSFSRQVLGKS